MNVSRFIFCASLPLLFLPAGLHAQTAESQSGDCSTLPTRTKIVNCGSRRAETRTIDLKNVTNQNDATEIMVAVRNSFDPSMKLFLVSSSNTLVVTTYAEEFARVEALVHSLDKPHKTHRLTYTITELDAGKAIGTQHFSMVVADGQRTTVKQGDKIPVATGSFSTDTNSSQTQFTYLDVGMNFDATLSNMENGSILKTKVEQSSLGQPTTIANVQEPVVRQTVLEGTTSISLGKPVMLGSIDVPNSTRRFDIAVVMEAIH